MPRFSEKGVLFLFFCFFQEGPEGVEGGGRVEQRKQEDAHVYLHVSVELFLSGCVCMLVCVFCMEKGRRDGGDESAQRLTQGLVSGQAACTGCSYSDSCHV